MKKNKIFTAAVSLAVAASLFAGCNGAPNESAQASRIEGGQTQISVNVNNGQNAPQGDFKFTYKGYAAVPGAPAAPVIEAFGEAQDQFEGASCAGQGMDIIYTYPGFKLYTYEDASGEIIDAIEVEDPLTDCLGLHVGQTVSDAKRLFGEPVQEDDFGVIFVSGATALQISTDGTETIISIVFRMPLD